MELLFPQVVCLAVWSSCWDMGQKEEQESWVSGKARVQALGPLEGWGKGFMDQMSRGTSLPSLRRCHVYNVQRLHQEGVRGS